MKTIRIADNEWVKGQWKHGFLEFIHAVNRVCNDRGIDPVFGEPVSLGDWWVPGMYCEQYPKARVIYSKGELAEREKRGEGYRMVLEDETLEDVWDAAWALTEPRLECRKGGDPEGRR